MHTKLFSAATIGLETHLVEIEADLSLGLLQFFIVGLPDMAIKESRQRIQTALKNCSIKLPDRKITINLAPADLKKEGSTFDLPIALSILLSAKIIEVPLEFLQETIFLGELALDGRIKSINGVLPIAFDALRLNKKRLIVPLANAYEAALIKEIEVIGIEHLSDLIALLKKEKEIKPTVVDYNSMVNNEVFDIDFDQVKGQAFAKKALQISAAGRHNILFVGSPGSGKTMLAKRLSTIMPKMNFEEILQTSKIYSITGKLANKALVTQRPFRSPHHTISQAGLVGGGSFPQPGEISLAHNGVLFLDELTEFKRCTLEVLRQPLEHHTVCISRALQTIEFPASFLLIAALNPCPCGFRGDKKRLCSCSNEQVLKYMSKISGPLMDRIDLQVTISSLDYETISQVSDNNLSSKEMLKQVNAVVEIQKNRFGKNNHWNAHMSSDEIDKFCKITPQADIIVKKAFDVLNLTMRGYHKLIKVARTIADLQNSKEIDAMHIKEALFYRSLENKI